MDANPRRPAKHKLSYTDNDMHEAILAVQSGESQAAAARRFGVPRNTLRDKLSGKAPINCKMGRKPVLTAEEERTIVRWILSCRTAGFPVTSEQLMTSVGYLVQRLGRGNPFNESMPGKRWYELFLKRHPEISVREGQNLTSARSAISQDNLENWFDEVRSHLETNDLLDVLKSPSRIFNCDESAFFLCPKKGKVLAGRGDKTVYNIAGNNEKENLTVLFTCSADGLLAPSLVVYKYERLPANIISRVPEGWGIGKSESGWMTCELFYEYVTNVFEPYLTKNNIKRPVILFMDGHRSHMTLHLSEFCTEKQIELVALYPNATHVLQPLDVAVFHPMKNGWKKGVAKWRFDHHGEKLKNEDFAPLLEKVIRDTIKPSTIVHGFKTCGLLSLRPGDCDMSKLVGHTPKTTRTSTEEIQELTCHLMFFERRIEPNVLQDFRSGFCPETKNEGLFLLWQGIINDVKKLKEGNNKQNVQEQEPICITVPQQEVNLTVEQNRDFQLTDIDFADLSDIFGDADEVSFDLPVIELGSTTSTWPMPTTKTQPTTESYPSTSTWPLPTTKNRSTTESSPSTSTWPLPTKPNISTTSPITQQQALNTTCSKGISISNSQSSSSLNSPLTSTPQPVTNEPKQQTSIITTPIKNIHPPISPVSNTSVLTPPNNPPNDIPSPFKDVLFWPGKPTNSNKKKKKVKIPTVVTSNKWKEYHHKIEKEKNEKERQKLERKAIREERKNQIKSKKPRLAKDKIVQQNCEEDEEENEDDDEEEEEILIKDKNVSFDLESLIFNKPLMEDVKIGAWVVVCYRMKGTEKRFIGQVVNVDGILATVKYLVQRGNKFVWPLLDDIDNKVPFGEILHLLKEPEFDRWGYLKFSV